METSTVVLVPRDVSPSEGITVDWEVALLSGLLRNTLEEENEACKKAEGFFHTRQEDERPVIPLPNVEKETLEKIIEYLEHIRDHPEPEVPKGDRSLRGRVDQWYVDFINVDPIFVRDIANGADYLIVPSLVELSAKKLAETANELIERGEFDRLEDIYGIWDPNFPL